MNDIHHLYHRVGFGLSPQQWQRRQSWRRDEALSELLRHSGKASALPLPESSLASSGMRSMSREQRAELFKAERGRVAEQNAAWLQRMAEEDQPALLERMCLFWHGHFACESRLGQLAVQQLNSIRQHALGNFRELLLAVARDPGMIRYLNNQQNRKGQPNENFARELMELFTLGRGHYTEKDVKEAARAFTGWSSNLRGEYVFRARQHDYGSKTIFGKSGRFGGEDVIDAILEKRDAARFITRKLYRYFVNEQVDENRVAELSRQFYESGYDIGRLMQEMLCSDWFYASRHMGSKFKSPVELLAGMMRQLGIRGLGTRQLVGLQRALGQVLFNPPNVAGWPGGRNWIDNSTLMVRLQLPEALYRASEFSFQLKEEPEREGFRKLRGLKAEFRWQPLYDLVEGQNEEAAFETLASYLLAVPPRIRWKDLQPHVSGASTAAFVQTLSIRLMSLPEYQLC